MFHYKIKYKYHSFNIGIQNRMMNGYSVFVISNKFIDGFGTYQTIMTTKEAKGEQKKKHKQN